MAAGCVLLETLKVKVRLAFHDMLDSLAVHPSFIVPDDTLNTLKIIKHITNK